MITEFINSIYCCNINDSLNKNIYIKYNINIVINCTKNYGYVDLNNIKKVRIPLNSELNYNPDIILLKKNLNNILEFIYNNFIDNNILIVCYDGNIISPLIIGLFINKYTDTHINLIKDIIKSKNKNFKLDYNLDIFLD